MIADELKSSVVHKARKLYIYGNAYVATMELNTHGWLFSDPRTDNVFSVLNAVLKDVR